MTRIAGKIIKGITFGSKNSRLMEDFVAAVPVFAFEFVKLCLGQVRDIFLWMFCGLIIFDQYETNIHGWTRYNQY